MVKYGSIYIDNEKVVVSSDGSCNYKKIIHTFNGKKRQSTCYVIRINNVYYRLHRIIAKVFLDHNILIRKNEGDSVNYDYDHRIIFKNGNSLDVRLENLEIVNQQTNLTRNKTDEDKICLIDSNGNIIDTDFTNNLLKKYSINAGCLRDVLIGNNKSLTTKKLPGKKLTALRFNDCTPENIKAKINEISPSRGSYLKDTKDGIMQIDINGKYIIRDISEVRRELGSLGGGLHMALSGKRNTCCGYVWIKVSDYLNDPRIAAQRLNKALSSTHSAKTLKAFPDDEN